MAKIKMPDALRYRLQYGVIRAIVMLMNLLPFRQRSAFMAWIMSRVIAPLAGYRRRIQKNLELVWPDMDGKRRNALSFDVTRHMGRTICELFSPRDLLSMAKQTELTGPGLVALEEAQAVGRPAIIVSGHFGNYDIIRAGLLARGFDVGAVYRHMNNPYFHEFYLKNISDIGAPLFQRGRLGLSQMIKHLKAGGTLAALIDVRVNSGVPLPFFGHNALTATSMAEIALRYNAVLIPVYGTRLPNGVEFTAHFEAPIPHSDPKTMMQALHRSLEARILQNPEQWFWVHNRWKGGRAQE